MFDQLGVGDGLAVDHVGEPSLDKASREALRAGGLSEDAHDRWLKKLGDWIDGYEDTGRCAVVACSVLTRHRRDVLREGQPHLRFCPVNAHQGALRDRVGADGAKRLSDDFARLEPLGPGEPGVTVSTEDSSTEEVVHRALAALGLDQGHS